MTPYPNPFPSFSCPQLAFEYFYRLLACLSKKIPPEQVSRTDSSIVIISMKPASIFSTLHAMRSFIKDFKHLMQPYLFFFSLCQYSKSYSDWNEVLSFLLSVCTLCLAYNIFLSCLLCSHVWKRGCYSEKPPTHPRVLPELRLYPLTSVFSHSCLKHKTKCGTLA